MHHTTGSRAVQSNCFKTAQATSPSSQVPAPHTLPPPGASPSPARSPTAGTFDQPCPTSRRGATRRIRGLHLAAASLATWQSSQARSCWRSPRCSSGVKVRGDEGGAPGNPGWARFHGDTVHDPRVWQIGPGHFAAIVLIGSKSPISVGAYEALIVPIHEPSHVTVEVEPLERTAITNAWVID